MLPIRRCYCCCRRCAPAEEQPQTQEAPRTPTAPVRFSFRTALRALTPWTPTEPADPGTEPTPTPDTPAPTHGTDASINAHAMHRKAWRAAVAGATTAAGQLGIRCRSPQAAD